VKHSPAPWKNDYPGVIFDADRRSIAIAMDYPGPEERKANALLMANAPVMLALLRALLPHAPEEAKPKLDAFLKKFE